MHLNSLKNSRTGKLLIEELDKQSIDNGHKTTIEYKENKFRAISDQPDASSAKDVTIDNTNRVMIKKMGKGTSTVIEYDPAYQLRDYADIKPLY